MRTAIRAALALAFVAGTAQAAEMTMFLQPNFTGRQATLRGESDNLASIGFTDQVSSLVIHSGRWQVCTEPGFAGYCATLGPGEYRSLDPNLNHRIESARLVSDERPGYSYEPRYRRDYAYDQGYGNGSIELFAGRRFRGPSMTLDHDAAFLAGSGFDNRASSAIINEGSWQLCTGTRFRGDCRVLGPGRYADLGMRGDVSSLRRVG